MGIIVIIFWIVGIVAHHLFGMQVPFLFRYAVHKYTVLFMIGLIASYMVLNLKKIKPTITNKRVVFYTTVPYIICGSGLLLFSITVFYCLAYKITNWDSWIITIGFGLACGMFMISTLSDNLEEFFKKQKLLISIGNASYSIYLLHYPVLVEVISYLKVHFSIKPVNPMLFTIIFAFISIFTLMVGWLFYWKIERPLLNSWQRSYPL